MTRARAPVAHRLHPCQALWVLSVSELAGMGRHALDVARVGIPGWKLAFLVPPGPLADRLRALGHPISNRHFGREAGTATSLRALARAAAAVRPSVIHSHLAWADLLVAALPTSAARVSTEHGIAGDQLLYQRTAAHAQAKRMLHAVRLRRTAEIVAVSRATAELVQAHWRAPDSTGVTVIPNGVDTPPEDPRAPTSGLRFGYLGRLASEKDLPTLLDAFDLVHRDHPTATLEIAGRGDEEQAVRALASRGAARAAIRLAGFVKPDDFFARVDVIVQPSRWENCSYTLLDALARRKGIVATAVGGNVEMLPERCLVDVGDHHAAAARMLDQAIDVGQRPCLPTGWPTVRDMAARIATVYERAIAGDTPTVTAATATAGGHAR